MNLSRFLNNKWPNDTMGYLTQGKLYPKHTEHEVLIWINFTLEATSQQNCFIYLILYV